MRVGGEFVPLSFFRNYAYIWMRQNLNETVRNPWRIITWRTLGKKNIQTKEFHYGPRATFELLSPCVARTQARRKPHCSICILAEMNVALLWSLCQAGSGKVVTDVSESYRSNTNTMLKIWSSSPNGTSPITWLLTAEGDGRLGEWGWAFYWQSLFCKRRGVMFASV